MQGIFLFFLCVCMCVCVFANVDTHTTHTHNTPLTLSFGSCAKQQKIANWTSVSAFNPTAWFWLGDAVYPYCQSPQCIKEAYETLKAQNEYTDFVSKLHVLEGTWDDHDYGQNDGTKSYTHKQVSQQMFLDFLNITQNDKRRLREGVYSSHTFGDAPTQVKVILLDTRYFKDSDFIPSVATTDIPFSAVVAAGIRWAIPFLGFGGGYTGDVLGELQWQWLEDQLVSSQAAVNIVVSSIQVTTPFTVVESWGHFPVARKRLFQLFEKTKPRGLMLVSGDVHYTQINGRQDGVVEVTTSGLTHSILGDGLSGAILTDILLPLYVKPNNTDFKHTRSGRAFYEGRNFAVMDFSFDTDTDVTYVNVGVHNMDGIKVITAPLNFSYTRDPSFQLQSLSTVAPFVQTFGKWRIARRIFLSVLVIWGIQIILILMGCMRSFLKRLTRGLRTPTTKKQH